MALKPETSITFSLPKCTVIHICFTLDDITLWILILQTNLEEIKVDQTYAGLVSLEQAMWQRQISHKNYLAKSLLFERSMLSHPDHTCKQCRQLDTTIPKKRAKQKHFENHSLPGTLTLFKLTLW